MADMFEEKRSEPRNEINQYYSVDFSLGDDPYIYQFKIWNVSSKGVCVIVKEDSSALAHFHVGDVLSMRYYREDAPSSGDYRKTKIVHITKEEQGHFKGHVLIGLSLLGEKTSA